MRLSPTNLDQLPDDVERFSYDRSRQKVGIVHFGIGAFARAHLATYCDAAMEAGEQDWMISGVSLRSDNVARQLNPQSGLYTLTERSGSDAKTRVIGSLREALVAANDAEAIAQRIASPSCHIVSFTVTEKGYCRDNEGALDFDLAEASFYPLLAEGLRRRRTAGLPGVTLLSCDNLAENGHELSRLFGSYTQLRKRHISMWVPDNCTIPSTMVDRIVPASTATDLDTLEARLGMRDEGAVFTERFTQWVVEDHFAGPRPDWEKHGVEFVGDVAPYETAKLRMLNGAHSLLAYVGLDRGYDFVHEAIADPGIRVLVDQLMREEAATSFTPAPAQDLAAYAETLTRRFADPALQHRLIQIAMDGSQKIPQRWLAVLSDQQDRGIECPVIRQGLAAWLRHVHGGLRKVEDPMAEQLAALWRSEGRHGIAPALFGENGLFAAHWRASENDLEAIQSHLGAFE